LVPQLTVNLGINGLKALWGEFRHNATWLLHNAAFQRDHKEVGVDDLIEGLLPV